MPQANPNTPSVPYAVPNIFASRTPDSGSFFPEHRGRAWSGSTEGVVTTPSDAPTPSPGAFLATPSPGYGLQKQDGYYSTAGLQQTPSESGLTTPSYSRSAGSYCSSDTGRNLVSCSSSEFLLPPEFQSDSDLPPFKAAKDDINSLTMTGGMRRANTLPDDKDLARTARQVHKKKHKCRDRKSHRHRHKRQSKTPRGIPVNDKPTTMDQSYTQYGQDGRFNRLKLRDDNAFTTIRGPSITTQGKDTKKLRRRWSSVEFGNRKTTSTASATLRPAASAILTQLCEDPPTTKPLPEISEMPEIPDALLESTASIPTPEERNIARTERERLTLRKTPAEQMQVPASITLRRASEVSDDSEATQKPAGVLDQSNESEEGTALTRLQGFLHQRRPSAAYLITNKDIESITELIGADLTRRSLRSKANKPKLTGSTLSSPSTPSPQVTNKGVLVPQTFPDLVLTVAQARTSVQPSKTDKDHLQVQSANTQSKHARTPSQESVHEVIWEGDQTTQSTASTLYDDGEGRSLCSNCLLQLSTSQDVCEQHNDTPAMEKGNPFVSGAFDPSNATASIKEWSSRMPRNDISLVVTSSDSASGGNDLNLTEQDGDGTPPQRQEKENPAQASSVQKRRSKMKIRPIPRPSISESNMKTTQNEVPSIEDVVSFPALPPRKSTEDWFSPVPEMLMTPPLGISRSLYDLGLDANFGPNSSRSITPKASHYFTPPPDLSVPNTLSPKISVEFRPDFDIRKKSTVSRIPIGDIEPPMLGTRKRSTIKELPMTVSRLAERGRMGSSIGSHYHERRRSSMIFHPPAQQRVRTIDNVHKDDHGPPSKWRAPSVCPTRQPGSPSSNEELQNANTKTSGVSIMQKVRSGLLDRVTLRKDKSAAPIKVDPVGIYGQLTGARRGTAIKARERCLLEDDLHPPHDCDDCAKDPRSPSISWIG